MNDLHVQLEVATHPILAILEEATFLDFLMVKSKKAKVRKPAAKHLSSLEYELLSRDVLAKVYSKQQQVVSVQHNISLPSKAIDNKGAPVMRQVDVFASFEGTEKSLPIVVQCKNWKSAVPLPIVDSLVGMLSSLQMPCRGMFIVPTRYQRGAQFVAMQQGLELCVLRQTNVRDFSDLKIPKLNGWVILRGYKSDQFQIFVPTDRAVKHGEELRKMGKLDPRIISIFDVDGTKIGVMADLHNSMHGEYLSVAEYDEYLVRSPQKEIFLKIGDDLVQILSLRGRFSGKNLEKKPYKNSLTHVFGSLNSGDVFFIDERKEISSPGDNLTAETDWFDMKAHFPHWFDETDAPTI